MAKRKFMCPQCNISYTTRKDAKKHMAQKKHKGGVVVTFIDKGVEKKLTGGKRLYWFCPKCDKKFKNEKAVRNHMKAKKHTGKPIVESAQISGSKKKKEVVVEEPKKEDPPIRTFCRITETDWDKIKDELPASIFHHINPVNGNHIMDYTDKNEVDLDYLFFKYDFVEIEMENADVVYCLRANDSKGVMLGNDLAEYLVVGITGINADGHIMIHHSDYDENTQLTTEQLITKLMETKQDNLACLVGIWKAPPKPVVKYTAYSGRGGQYSGYGGQSLTGYAAEEWGSRVLDKKKFAKQSKAIGETILPAPTHAPIKQASKVEEEVKKDKIIAHPVYKIDEYFIYCDRVVDYDIYI